jgi:hypothetical protein
VLTVPGPDEARVDILYLDTRTEAKTEMPFLTFELRRR